MPGDPAPDNTPTPPAGVPLPHTPLLPPAQPWPGPTGGYPQQPGYTGPPGPDYSQPQGGYPSYLDTPAPVVSKADLDKPPADFDG
ncbi:hypothetical protein [Kutzneria sp. NPDC052558]|uniref:hypothetical protein n=1 Tax=Kutzneria sp. NPDC052558 TaxID=3364121 RepID=UPI0037C6D850